MADFELPKVYPVSVEMALENKTYLIGSNCDQFVQTISHAMLSRTRKPTSGDYEIVGHKIVKEYPFLRSPIGNGTVWLHKTYMNSFCHWKSNELLLFIRTVG